VSRHPYGYPDPVPWRDEVARLDEIRAAHPEIELRPHVPFAPWRARIAVPDGNPVVIISEALGSFCDALEMHFAPGDQDEPVPRLVAETRPPAHTCAITWTRAR
jgi:hypothetical protein